MVEKQKEYSTDSLGLAAYLMSKDFRFLRADLTLGRNDKPVVVFVFEDKLGIGRDLEIDYMRSPEKKFRDMLFFCRNEIEKMIRQKRSQDDREVRSAGNRRFDVEE